MVVVKVEVAVQGDARESDVITKVNNRIRYLERPELLKSRKSSRGTDADDFCLDMIID